MYIGTVVYDLEYGDGSGPIDQRGVNEPSEILTDIGISPRHAVERLTKRLQTSYGVTDAVDLSQFPDLGPEYVDMHRWVCLAYVYVDDLRG